MDVKQFIFSAYKDKIIIAKTFKRDIMKKYKLTVDEVHDLYVKINNYQVKNFGSRLSINKALNPYNKEELDIIRSKVNRREYERRKCYEK